MIKYSNMYHIDDIVLSNYCPNTNKIPTNERYVKFKTSLHSFHRISNIYDKNINSFAAYICNSILLNSLELNKNILSYENYFYNVITGFSRKKAQAITSIQIAHYWTSLVKVYESLLSIVRSEEVLEVKTLLRGVGKTKFINITPVNNNYYWEIPVQIVKTDFSLHNILIIPITSHQSIYSNLNVLNTIAAYPNASSLSVIQISLEKPSIILNSINLSTSVRRYATDFIESFYIDFSHANLTNCPSCPISPCTIHQMFGVVVPNVKNTKKNKYIELVNIK
ncbi:hypothetical protein FDH01_gp070 [Acinetobacter phage vB_AbaM_ME3]|uniref:Uncharacterized protein n=1 Tax=Acinetobacter phage vB_AbaM_ME3 TaxID=1837876 RepID=A0A172Q044_9CAUD|nr:hypothetical protein FDH01_gp070 [Acinetobacter phage vB_AbaM_ME3]AND75231.1 hypothetical protein ME3_70 [Acinetobacter phage vB_AbaM_ME3]